MTVEITVPKSLNDITLEQYRRVISISEDMPKNRLQEVLISILCNVSPALVKDMRLRDRAAIIAQCYEALKQEPQHTMQFDMNGTTFYFHQNLSDITVGEYADCDNFQSDRANLHKLMAVLYRPAIKQMGSRWELEPYEPGKYEEAMKQMPAGIAVGALLFFCRLGSQLSTHILSSLAEEELRLPSSKATSTSGDGSHSFILWQAETYFGQMKSLDSNFIAPLCGLLTKAMSQDYKDTWPT